MAIKSFHLFGEDDSVTREIDVDTEIDDLEALKFVVADYFTIVEPSGVTFQGKGSGILGDLEAVRESDGPIGIAVDGHAVREPPGPHGLPFVGTYFEVYPEHLGNHQRMFETYGPVFKTTDMGRTNYFTNDPAIALIAMSESPFFSKIINENHPLYVIKDNIAGLFLGDTDSEGWRSSHKFMVSALSPKAVRHYTPLIQKTTEASYSVFDELDERGEAWNAYPYMLKLTSKTIGKLILNQDYPNFDGIDAPQPQIVRALGDFVGLTKKVSARGEWYSHLPFGAPKKLKDVNIEVRRIVEKAIEECEGVGGEDLPMVDAALQATSIVDYATRAVDPQGNKCPHEIMVNAILVLTGAGFTTTSTLLSWLIYGLVTYPGMQDRLLQELVDHGVNAETRWTYDNTNALLFLDKFIKETQRLHNPASQPARTTKEDLILPGGYRIPSGATMIVALHHIHKNADLWDNPHRFNPDRWDTEEVKKRHKCAFIPFAYGPRSCIGFNLALQEMKVIIPSLVYRYEFFKTGEAPVQYDGAALSITPVNLYVRAKRRTEWPAPTPK